MPIQGKGDASNLQFDFTINSKTVLLSEAADAKFRKRSEVKDACDRNANPLPQLPLTENGRVRSPCDSPQL